MRFGNFLNEVVRAKHTKQARGASRAASLFFRRVGSTVGDQRLKVAIAEAVDAEFSAVNGRGIERGLARPTDAAHERVCLCQWWAARCRESVCRAEWMYPHSPERPDSGRWTLGRPERADRCRQRRGAKAATGVSHQVGLAWVGTP